jgi:anti-sigma B factor antagonist
VIDFLHDQSTDRVEGRMASIELDHMPDAVPGQLEIAVREQGTTTTIALCGELDLAEQDAARHAIRRALMRTPECLVLDLSHLSFIDSTGIRVVLEVAKRSSQQNVHLVIVPGSAAVQRTFEVLQMTSVLPFLAQAA